MYLLTLLLQRRESSGHFFFADFESYAQIAPGTVIVRTSKAPPWRCRSQKVCREKQAAKTMRKAHNRTRVERASATNGILSVNVSKAWSDEVGDEEDNSYQSGVYGEEWRKERSMKPQKRL